MKKESGKYTKNELAYIAASKKVRLESDTAALVLASHILYGYDPNDTFLENSDIILVELVPGKAEAVINNAAELLNSVDHRFSFMLHDFNLDNEDIPKNKVIKLINDLYNISELNPLTFHVITNISESFFQKEVFDVFKDLYSEYSKLKLLYILNESNYYSFSDKLIFPSELSSIWLHPLPGETDIHYISHKYSIDRVNCNVVNPDIFTSSARVLMNRAQQQSILMEEGEISYTSILLAAAEGVETSEALIQCLNLSPERLESLRDPCRFVLKKRVRSDRYYIDSGVKGVIKVAMEMASAKGHPDPEHPGLISAFHLIGALSMSEEITKDFETNRGIVFEKAVNKVADWYYGVKVSPSLGDRSTAIREIGYKHSQYRTMIGNIFGQNEALNMINESFCLDYFTYYGSDKRSKAPTVFLFIGPEHVGKGHLARLMAESYHMELQYYNLLLYAEGHSLPVQRKKKSFSQSMLVFENVAAARPVVIDELCQLIETGMVKDKASGEELDFSYSVIVIIAGSDEDLELIKVQHLNDRLIVHQDAVLKALPNMVNRDNGRPLLPAKLISLLKKHQVIVFKHLQHEDLLNICERKLAQFSAEIEASGAKRLTYHNLLPDIILLTEGGKPKPSAISTAVEMLISAEVRKFITGFDESSAKHLLMEYDRLHFTFDYKQGWNLEVALHFITRNKPKVLLLTERKAANYFSAHFDCVIWNTVSSLEALEDCIENDDYDYYLLDMWFNVGNNNSLKKAIIDEFYLASQRGKTTLPLPVIAEKLFGERYLRIIKSKLANKPVVLFNRIDDVWTDNVVDYLYRQSSFYIEAADKLRYIRERYSTGYPVFINAFRYDLFLELLEANFIMGIINTEITGDTADLSEEHKKHFTDCIDTVHQRLHRKKMAAELHERDQMLAFTPRWEFCEEDGLINVCLSDLRIIENRLYDQK